MLFTVKNDGPRNHWSEVKSDRERQMSDDITLMWNVI